ncbi:glycogen synthase GlgA [Microbacterium sp. JB110]|uniref:glycogen synthase GlgA n=1 Tax=Microbacterium sp. JB110 TaxID=2024477 RepID=UPI00097F3A40|nr:glycogen synthase GlgA [Microbacterium sp. JB110]RCS63215.1 glycogen synthase GlgA [Microbacterium sp. JB110]SJM52283.1 Glycogen synthase, ADP-glucose transglucosylase [Frigoribacterium sp. JB110]
MALSARRRRVLSVASECAPLVKTGGLADVVGALPAALAELGWHSRVLIPAYPSVRARAGRSRRVWRTDDLFGGPAAVRSCSVDGLDLLLLDAPHLFDRPGGPYSVDGHDHPDNHVRFAALSWAAARIAIDGLSDRWRPDLVHAHDWQAGLAPSYLTYAGSDVPTVMTIHNIAFQGIFGPDALDRLRLPTWDHHPDALEYHGLVSALKAGMVHASRVTTVSRTYAEQLATAEFGFGLEGVVAARTARGEMTGIVNGIDTAVWDPSTDPHVVGYDADSPARKADNRGALLREFDLDDPDGPLAVVVTRLTHQKGVDLLLEALPHFIAAGGAVAVLGSGEPDYEHWLRELSARFPRSVGVRIGYDEPLSHRMYAGADLVVVPSRFEPCGLTQLYGLRYGSLPLVSSTGGLRDTVADAVPAAMANSTATGFVFSDISARGLADAFDRATSLYADGEAWAQVRDRAMREHVDWAASARQYGDLFEELVR